MIIEGTLSVGSLRELAAFNGKPTDWYSIKLNISDKAADQLEAQGVKVSTYEGKKQRHFKSKFPPVVVDSDGAPFSGDVPRGSLLRIAASLGSEHPQHGVAVYFKKAKVLELAEDDFDEEGF